MSAIDNENMEASGHTHYGVRKHLGRVVYKSAGNIETGEDLHSWMERCGLRQVDAADVLGVTKTHLQKLLKSPKVSSTLSKLAAAHEKSITPMPDETNIVDSNVALGDYHEVTDLNHLTVLTAGIAAVARGMTTMSGLNVDVAMPQRPAVIASGEARGLKWHQPIWIMACPLYPERIESRIDTEGNRYRIADPVRIVVDCYRMKTDIFHLEEIVRDALDTYGCTREEILDFAERGDAQLPAADRVTDSIKADLDKID